jgi:hypothetical protein
MVGEGGSNGPDPSWQSMLKFNFGYLKKERLNDVNFHYVEYITFSKGKNPNSWGFFEELTQ